MGRRTVTVLSLIMIGCTVFAGMGSPAHSAAAKDPYAALQIHRPASESSIASFNLKALDGGVFRSRDVMGKVVLLNFWATWCGPCKEEMPSLARLQAQFDPARVRVVTVTADMQVQGIKQFLTQLGIDLPVLFDEEQEVSRSFMVRGLPTTVLIAPDGRPLGRAVGPRAWDSEESVALIHNVLEGTP
ncbi:MAG TPA: TlpA disulfide reductase family protein [Nitrospira sp.]|nr:TlpA disulfide reductase family protein [Nitrospira sp.]